MKVRKEQKRLLAAEIGAAILQGDYRPGEWLRQIDLEEAFAAKRFDVRSALTQLAAIPATRTSLPPSPPPGSHANS